MKTFACLALSLSLLSALGMAQEPAGFPGKAKEHEWLQQFVGEWDSECEANLGDGKPPVKCKGEESVKAIGDLWVLGRGKGEMMGVTVHSVLTLGYDPNTKKYVGTWVDSMTSHLWHYQGEVDATGKILTLNTEGPDPTQPGKTAKYRDVFEFKSKDHKVLTSSMQGPDGKWTTFMTANYHRKKA